MATNSKFIADIGLKTDNDLDIGGNTTIDGNATISGNLTVNGTSTTINATTTSVEDNMLELANANTSSDTLDIGIYGNYDDGLSDGGATEYTGLFRDASDSTWKLFDGLEVAPTTTVNTSGAGYSLADLTVGDLTATTLTATNGLTGSSITYPTSDGTNGQVIKTDGSGTLSFGDIPAGYADSDARSAISAGTGISYDNSTGVITNSKTTLDSLTDCTISASTPTATTNPPYAGAMWIEEDTGDVYVCTNATTNNNTWVKTGSANGITTSGSNTIIQSPDDTNVIHVNDTSNVQIGSATGSYTFGAKLIVGDGDDNDGITIQSGTTHQGNVAFNKGGGTTAEGRISYQHGTDYMQFFTDNTERMKIDSVGETTLKRAGSGGSGVLKTLNLNHAGTSVNDGAKISFTAGTSTEGAGIASTGQALNSADLRFYAGGNVERMTLDPSGDLTVGTSSAGFHFDVSTQLLSTTFGTGGNLTLACTNSSGSGVGGQIFLGGDSRGDINKNTILFKNGSDVTRYSIDKHGTLMNAGVDGSYAHNTYAHAAVFGANSVPNGTVVIEDYDVSSGIGNTVLRLFLRDQDPATHAVFISFGDGGGSVGSVTHNDDGGGVSFNTVSDYRLKENVNYEWDALTLVNQLKPAKYNFITNPAKTVQGMLAHEVMDIVPSSVRGDKDHMMEIGTITDSEGDVVSEGVYEHFCKTDEGQTWTQTGIEPLYQQLDYSRLVPLLTKAMQEQQTLIESLTARITDLEG